MKLIIDIPEEDYKFIKDLQFYNSGRRCGRTIERNVINAIRNGVPYAPIVDSCDMNVFEPERYIRGEE